MALILKLTQMIRSSKKVLRTIMVYNNKAETLEKWPVTLPSIVSSFGILVLDEPICRHQTICST